MGRRLPVRRTALAGVSHRPIHAAAPQDAAALQNRAKSEEEDRERDHRQGEEDDPERLPHLGWIVSPLGLSFRSRAEGVGRLFLNAPIGGRGQEEDAYSSLACEFEALLGSEHEESGGPGVRVQA